MSHDYKIVGCESYIGKELSDKLIENFEVIKIEDKTTGLITHLTVPINEYKPDYNIK